MAINYNPNAFNAASVTGQNGYNVTPQPQSGSGVFGAVPGAVALPQPFQSLSGVFPSLSTGNASASGDVLNNLQGQLSPDTLNQLKTTAAESAFSQGMAPGSGFGTNEFLDSVANTSQQEQAAGESQYNSLVPPVFQTETVAPSLEAELAEFNASNAASPNPTMAGLANLFGNLAGFGAGGGLSGLSSLFGGNEDPALNQSLTDYNYNLLGSGNDAFSYSGDTLSGGGALSGDIFASGGP